MIGSGVLPKARVTPKIPKLCGRVIFRPWFDAVAVRVVTRGYFPVSRGWAAAWAADGDPERFREEAGANLPDFAARRALAGIADSARAYEAEAAVWEAALFAPSSPSRDQLIAAERARNRAAFRFMRGRSAFLPWLRRLPPIRWTVAPPEEVAARHGSRRAMPEAAYPPPAQPKIDTSHAIPGDGRRIYWVRFPSPVLGDTAWAKVVEPEGVDHPPTLIFLHGIGVELEMWPPTVDALDDLVKHGVRIVRSTAPWHAQRMVKGFYGGEPIMARGPEGLLTCFQAWVAETAVLVDWARNAGSATVGVGGYSLGALAGQLVASAGRTWPENLRADALILVGTTGRALGIVDGSLARGIGLAAELNRTGWTRSELERWLPLLEPHAPPVMSPGRIVMILGEADDLTPFAGGLALARQWNVPPENLFLRRQGHFSAALGLLSDPAPIERLIALLRR
jgi:pimeloyl-ACP methyl ester carboxylesterase